MKNYFMNKSDSKSFVLGYTIAEGNIIVRYGDKSIESIPYSITHEKGILKVMRQQVMDSKISLGDIRRRIKIFGGLTMDIIILLFMFIITKISVGIPLIPSTIGFIIFPSFLVLATYMFIYYKIIGDDIKKNLLFLSNEDCLNVTIRDNLDSTMSLDDKLKRKIFNANKEIPFSLNTIDGIGYGELKRIYKKVGLSKCRKRKKEDNF